MQTHAEVNDVSEPSDDWVTEEPTFDVDNCERSAREHLARGLAQLVASTVSVSAVLVVVRAPGLPVGVTVGAAHDIDPVVLAELLACAHDDGMVAATARVVLGNEDQIEVAVAHDHGGVVRGLIVVRARNRRHAWLRLVLARAAASLAGWPSTETPPPSDALLEAIREPALVHDAGFVLGANPALAKALGKGVNDIIGLPISSIVKRLETVRTCSLVHGGKARTALILEPSQRSFETCVLEVVERVIGRRYALVRQVAQLALDDRDRVRAAMPAYVVEELVTLALLDLTSVFEESSAKNQIEIGVRYERPWVVLQFVARGVLCRSPDMDHIGAVVCGSPTRSLGGRFLVDASSATRREIRISLPGAW